MSPPSPLLQQKSVATTSGTPGSSAKKERANLNVQDVLLGNVWIKPWYPSFYPEELVGRRTEKLFVCQWCFRYSREVLPSVGHAAVCPLRDSGPPGDAIYEQDAISIYEVDGEDQKLYTQNLSLFAKLFLDTKSVFFDVTTFLYYLLVYRDPCGEKSARGQVVGFFSKEKLSWDNNNLACILVFPPWQRKGFGQMLMEASYVLSKREENLGGPEKPLSEPGRCGYIRYWSSTIARYLAKHPAKKTITIQDISDETWIALEDIVATLKEMEVLDRRKKGNAKVVVNKAKVRQWIESNKVKLTPPMDHEAFIFEGETEEDLEE